MASRSPTPVEPESRFLVGVTGASGVEYARRLIEILGDRTDVIITKDAAAVIEVETGLSAKEFAGRAGMYYRGEDLAAPPASGSHLFRALVVVPCSGTTLAKIASGIADNLVTRAAAVALKEHRLLILVPRETPLSAIALENQLKLARLGVVILPASPGFYGTPRRVADLVDFVVARILDQLGVEHAIGVRWAGPPE
ncbi:MAG: UbiX family flavin prenyltransferase [Methanobacteriota archaeon]|nr:MAG: UbiX family flavin prenyltransferase [Euryarchaeota archaeon]TLZ68463.1 MAG: UbiX family flavin prenyltransferase [Euryarchaeota archaeon]